MSEFISLDLFDRIILKDIVLSKKDEIGGLDKLKIALDVLDKTDFSDEEIEKFGIKIGERTIQWNSNEEVSIEFSKSQLDFLKQAIKNKNNWNLDIRNLKFAEKFHVVIEDSDEKEPLAVVQE